MLATAANPDRPSARTMRPRPKRRTLRLESLETRATPAVIVVDSLTDEPAADGLINLREALWAARYDTVADVVEGTQRGFGADEIRFDPALFADGPGTIRLTRGVPLEITGGLDDALTLVGPGPDLLTLDADVPGLGLGAGPGMHHFRVLSPAHTMISGLRLVGADHRTDGAIAYGSDLTLLDLVIEGNSTRGDGAAISSLMRTEVHADPEATLRIEGSVIRDNSVPRVVGSIVEVRGGTLEIVGSSIVDNHTAFDDAIVSVEAAFGGAIDRVTVLNSTLSGNRGGAGPVGLYVQPNQGPKAEVAIAWSTLTDNERGLLVFTDSTAPVRIDASIVAGNLGKDVDVISSDGINALVITDSLAPPSEIDPLLAPLRDNGGGLPTHALLPGSPAIDRVLLNFPVDPLVDQRGLPRGVEGDGFGTARADIGAYEAQGVPAFTPGDYNRNGVVDAADYSVWRDAVSTGDLAADGDGDLDIDADDRAIWASALGSGLVETPAVIPPSASAEEAGEQRPLIPKPVAMVASSPRDSALLLYLDRFAEAVDDEDEEDEATESRTTTPATLPATTLGLG